MSAETDCPAGGFLGLFHCLNTGFEFRIARVVNTTVPIFHGNEDVSFSERSLDLQGITQPQAGLPQRAALDNPSFLEFCTQAIDLDLDTASVKVFSVSVAVLAGSNALFKSVAFYFSGATYVQA